MSSGHKSISLNIPISLRNSSNVVLYRKSLHSWSQTRIKEDVCIRPLTTNIKPCQILMTWIGDVIVLITINYDMVYDKALWHRLIYVANSN